MLQSLHIRGYRSLEKIDLPLRPLTVVTGPNGSGKSNLYRCLQLLARAAHGELARALVEEGGMPSVLWSGPRRRSSRRPAPAAFSLEVRADAFGYAFTCGLPIPGASMFNRDPEIKTERAWLGPVDRPSARFLERDHASAKVRAEDGELTHFDGRLDAHELVLSQVQDARRFADLEAVRGPMRRWRFYHHFRTDADSPLRQPRQGTRTPSLAGDGGDLAAALQTIREIGDASALAGAIARLQPGAQLQIVESAGWFDLQLHLPGLLRPLGARELSDGTLRYLALVAALLSPRPAPLLAFNEPESSLHPDLLPALAELFAAASARSQIWITTHSPELASALEAVTQRPPIRLFLEGGATTIAGQGLLWNASDDD